MRERSGEEAQEQTDSMEYGIDVGIEIFEYGKFWKKYFENIVIDFGFRHKYKKFT